MKFVEVKKDGKILKHEIINNKDVVEDVRSLSTCLGLELEIENGTKFKTFLSLLFKEKEFFNKLFHQELKGMTLQIYQKQIAKRQNIENNKNEDGEELMCLEIAKMFEVLKFDKGNSIDLFPVLVGIAKTPEGEETYMPVSLSPINDLKNYQIMLNKMVDIFQDRMNEKGEIELQPFMTAACSITVYDALQAIIYEISYFGTPEEKMKQKQEFLKKVKLEDKIFELEQGLESSVESEEYEKAARLKKELDRLKNKKTKNA